MLNKYTSILERVIGVGWANCAHVLEDPPVNEEERERGGRGSERE